MGFLAGWFCNAVMKMDWRRRRVYVWSFMDSGTVEIRENFANIGGSIVPGMKIRYLGDLDSKVQYTRNTGAIHRHMTNPYYRSSTREGEVIFQHPPEVTERHLSANLSTIACHHRR